MKNILRSFVALWYLLGWVSHVYLAFANPEIYRNFCRTALLPGLRDLWQMLIFPNITIFALALAAFELTVGLLMIGKGRKVELALVLSMLFNLFLVVLGLSGQAADEWSDFLMNRLPNLLFVLLQLPLLFVDFEHSIYETVAIRLSKQRTTLS